MKAAGEETRMRLLVLCAHSELTVSELIQILGQSQPRVSRHLKLLCEAGLIDRFQEGSWVYYRLASKTGNSELARSLVDLVPEGDSVVARDLERLSAVKQARMDAASEYFRENASRWKEIRSLYVAEKEVEKLLLRAFEGMEIADFLDIGTGTGRILELMGSRADYAVGIDTSREMLAYARTAIEDADLRNCQVRLGDMYNLPFSNETQDAIVIHQVLHFADRPQQVIEEAARVLRPGGRLVVADFAPHSVKYLSEDHAHRQMGFDENLVWNWCEAAGLQKGQSFVLKGDPLTVIIWVAHAAEQEVVLGEVS
nr:metalloregulator ArsR/SmtB family transcription factor [Sneathiella chinensis]